MARTVAWVSALLLVTLSARAQTSPPPQVTDAPGAREYPAADGLLLKQDLSVALSRDGIVTRHEERWLKVLTDWLMRNNWLDPRIDWNDARAELTVDGAWTWMVDGTRVDARANSLVPNTAPGLDWAVPYAHMRQLVVAQVGVEHGATSGLAFTVRDRKPAGVPPWGLIPLAGPLPILDQRITLEVPEGVALQTEIYRAQGQPVVTREGGQVRWTLTRQDVPGLNVQENPSGWPRGPTLAWSCVSSWDEVRGFLERRLAPALAADPVITGRAEKILQSPEPASLPEEKVARLHAFVLEGIRTVDGAPDAFDWAMRPAGQVLQSGVGHSLDKAVLLAALLRGAGLLAHVALSTDDLTLDTRVASPAWLERVLVRVSLPTGVLWLDPTASQDLRNRFTLAGHPVLVLDGTGGPPQALPPLTPESNRARLWSRVSLSPKDGGLAVEGTAQVDLLARYHPVVGFDRSKDRISAVAGRVAGAFGGAHTTTVQTGLLDGDALALGVALEGGTLAPTPSGLVRLPVPRVPGSLDGGSLQPWRTARTLPILVPGPASEQVEASWTLPEGWEVAWAPPDVEVDNPVGRFHRTTRVEKGTLVMGTELVLKVAQVDPAAWPDLRALLLAREAGNGETVLLRPQPREPAFNQPRARSR